MNNNFQIKGSSILELLLFLPLGLFFLFVVIDAGLSLTQKAAINDAFRSSINSLPAYAKIYKDKGELSKKVAEELNANIAKVFASYSSADYQIFTRLYRLEVDPLTGKSISDVSSLVEQYEFGRINESSLLRKFVSADAYINQILEQDLTINNFAEPQGVVNDTADFSRSGLRYAPISWLLYAEVRAVPVGVNSNYLKSVLGGLYSIQLQSIEKIRDY